MQEFPLPAKPSAILSAVGLALDPLSKSSRTFDPAAVSAVSTRSRNARFTDSESRNTFVPRTGTFQQNDTRLAQPNTAVQVTSARPPPIGRGEGRTEGNRCYTPDMSRVEEIEDAINRLSPEEFRRFAQWFREREQERWDAALDRDSASGKLDFLFEEAKREGQEGLLREWPPTK